MSKSETLLTFLNELNANGRIQYDDYSRLFDLVSEMEALEESIDAAKADINALLWLNGNCEYCEHGEKENFSGASRWNCSLGSKADCKPNWRGVVFASKEVPKAAPSPMPAKPMSRAERLFGPKETWTHPDIEVEDVPEAEEKRYKGFLLIRCSKCGQVRGFCAKEPIAASWCRACNEFTPLDGLLPMQVRCKCGSVFRYKTNLTEDSFSYSCLSCGAPVDLAYNKKGRRYQTVL